MRVTNSMMINNLMRNMTRNLNQLDKTQQQMATGKKFINPSDDPIGVSRSLRLNTEVSSMEQYKRNAEDAQSWMDTAEMATNNMMSVFQRVRELTVQAANDTNSPAERNAIATEIGQLRDQMINIGNSTYAGSYIFSGYKTDRPLLKADGTYDLGGSPLYTSEVIDVNVGIGDKLGINNTGQRLFGLSLVATDIDAAVSLGVVDNISGVVADFGLTGGTLSLSAANPISVTAGTGDKFNINYNGADVTLTLTAQSYDGSPGKTLNNFVADLQTQIAASPLNGHVVAVNDNGHVVFYSDASISVKNTTPATSFDTDMMGIANNKTSSALGKKVNSGDHTQLIDVFNQLITDLQSGNTAGISQAISRVDIHMNNVNAVRAEMGVKTNRITLTLNRIDDDMINLKKMLSSNEDADMAEVIMNLQAQENVYKASLSGGAKVIQPSLVDFLR